MIKNLQFIRELPNPDTVKALMPVPSELKNVKEQRDQTVRDIFTGKDDRFVLIIGPCSADRQDAVGISKKQAVAAYEELLKIAYAGAKGPKGIMLPGLGKMLKAKSKARLGRNPATGETIKIPARTKAKFRLCKAAKDAVLA